MMKNISCLDTFYSKRIFYGQRRPSWLPSSSTFDFSDCSTFWTCYPPDIHYRDPKDVYYNEKKTLSFNERLGRNSGYGYLLILSSSNLSYQPKL